jgi:hypothetical protein
MLQEAFFFFSEHSGHVEVSRNDKLELVFFFILPYMHSLPDEKKADFHENVDRSSIKAKV